jgi:aminoglycoside 6'-N-acetyltransferase
MSREALLVLSFRALEPGDLPMLSEWLSESHVSKWWREPSDIESVRGRYGSAVEGSDPTDLFVVELDGAPIGMIQRYLVRDDDQWERSLAPFVRTEDAAGIDYLIGAPSAIGRGVGSAMIASFARETWAHRADICRIVVAVQRDNRASWRALERAGFHRVSEGRLESTDPGDEGVSYVYVAERP